MLKRAFGTCTGCGQRVGITATHDHLALIVHDHGHEKPDHQFEGELTFSDIPPEKLPPVKARR